MGGGKSSTSTQTVSIPPEVLARYNAVNARAEEVAKQPFQQYGGEFVAPLTPTQTAGIQATSAASQLAQPYFGAATGLTMSGARDVGPLTQGQIGYYENPYTQAVAAPTLQALQQQQGQERVQQQAQAIRSGAFGGDRSGLERANLARQQTLGTAQAIAPIYQQGYQQAVQTAMGQQGVVAQDLARRMQAGQQIAGLGTGAQQAALQGAQAQIGAGTLQQQTQQAQDTAQYQQFLQERGYPFQVAQFLANIAMGTGALSGSTTTTTQPRGFFSNRGGFKTGESLQRSGKAYGGGLDPNSMGGAVYEPGAFERGGYATSGAVVDPNDLAAILAQQRQSFGPFAAAGPYGQAAGAAPHGPSGIVPQQQLATPKLVTAGALPKQPSGGSDISKGYSLLDEASKGLTGKGVTQRIGEKAFGKDPTAAVKDDAGNVLKAAQPAEKGFVQEGWDKLFGAATGGGIMPRDHYADGGGEDSQADEAIPYDPSDVTSGKDPIEGVLKAGSQKPQMLKPASGGGSGGGGGSKLGLGKLAGSALGSTFGPVGSVIGGTLGSLLPFNEGGVVPRHGYQTAGAVSDLPIDAEIVERAPGLDPNVVSELKREEQRQAAIPQDVKGLAAARPQEEQQIDYRSMVENAAKQKGLDVGHATRLVQGESGFKPIAGDEGSSGSLWQLHVGGLSEKYPNPGLGDDYFAQRRPELAKSFSPAQKIAYLNDPRNQQDITDFATDYIAKNGARPWTVARNQGLFGLSGQGVGAPRPSADVGRPTEAKATEPGFFDRNKGIILPVLQGLGAMASSKSISPWAAALQGLGAGAKAYGEEETRQAGLEQAKAQTFESAQRGSNLSFLRDGTLVRMPDGSLMLTVEAMKKGLIPLGGKIAGLAENSAASKYLQSIGINAPAATQYLKEPEPKVPDLGPKPIDQSIDPNMTDRGIFGNSSRQLAQKDAYRTMGLTPAGAAQVSKDYETSTAAAGVAANQNTPIINSLAGNTSKIVNAQGLDAPGKTNEFRANIANGVNTLARSMGYKGDDILAGDTNAAIQNKLNTFLASQSTEAAGQHNLGALRTMLGAMAQPDMPPQAQAKIAAQIMSMTQKAKDRDAHREVFGDVSGGSFATAGKAFDDDTRGRYEREERLLSALILKDPQAVEKLTTGTKSPQVIEQYFRNLSKATGVPYTPGLSRYFVGGVQ